MKKSIKKTMKILLIVSVAIMAIYGFLLILRATKKKEVKVYLASDIAMTDYWGDESSTSGMVTLSELQKIEPSSTKTVKVIFVKEGDKIKKGDKILSYDTTLTNLNIQKAQITLEKAQLELETAEKELKKLMRLKSWEYWYDEYQEYSAQLQAAQASARGSTSSSYYSTPNLTGSGTQSDPYWIQYNDGIAESAFDLTGKADGTYYYVLYTGSGISAQPYLEVIAVKTGTSIVYKYENAPDLVYPNDPAKSSSTVIGIQGEVDDAETEMNNAYSLSDLTAMRKEKKSEVEDKTAAVKMAELELKKLRQEQEDGIVYSTINGYVKTVRNPDEAYNNQEAIVEISGENAGYYITGSASENEIKKLKVGQVVSVNSWKTGSTYEGVITEIETTPTTENQGWSSGNNNVSWYPFKVFVDESAELSENDYVDMSYQSEEQESDAWYLMCPFVRSENGKSYVYIQGESGKLEKRWVQTGKNIWGSYLEIKNGLTLEDYVAFPYGKDVEVGSKTRVAAIDELYG